MVNSRKKRPWKKEKGPKCFQKMMIVWSEERVMKRKKKLIRKVLNEIRENPDKIPPNPRYNDRRKVKAATMKVNKVIALIRTESITETNIVLRAAGNVVAEMVGHKIMNPKESRTPHWRIRILEKQKALCKDLGQLNRMKRNELQNEGTISKLERKYRIVEKGIDMVHEEVQQRLVAILAKLERYDNRTEQYRQNRLFESNQKKLFEELDRVEKQTVVPDAEESTRFWSDIWDKPVKHKDNPEWLRNVEEEARAHQLDRCLQENNVPSWMVTGKTLLCVKELEKGIANFRPIACLPLLWKLLTGILAEELHEHLEQSNILPWEQKGCRKGSRGTKDQLLIDKMIVKNCKIRLTSLDVAWIDYRKAYDMVPHSWIEKCMNMFGVAVNVRSFISESMKHWNTELNAGQNRLGNVKIKRGIFQGDSLSHSCL
ncbi:uncharacterized protein LOC119583012 [Penaeus monodon]|uniref:uncharacterized protein LOC119583012 n=1 Tax=Penaeus monodon TaxID=6687 RepID=UPI0018A742C1|nr:uncharacterized protein LOC119583012 [Penaeus monodon]